MYRCLKATKDGLFMLSRIHAEQAQSQGTFSVLAMKVLQIGSSECDNAGESHNQQFKL
jgi:hypothetical protein